MDRLFRLCAVILAAMAGDMLASQRAIEALHPGDCSEDHRLDGRRIEALSASLPDIGWFLSPSAFDSSGSGWSTGFREIPTRLPFQLDPAAFEEPWLFAPLVTGTEPGTLVAMPRLGTTPTSHRPTLRMPLDRALIGLDLRWMRHRLYVPDR